MVLIVENGEGLSEADSFFSIDQANQYFSDRGMSAWAEASATAAAKEAAARTAADYLAMAFEWHGEPSKPDQALCWPRVGVDGAASNVVPRKVWQAALLIAYHSLGSRMLEKPADERVVTSEKKVLEGVGSTETSYAVVQPKEASMVYIPQVDALLAGFVRQKLGASRLSASRAVRR